MARSAEQKIKLLVLYELLLKHSDEEHPMTTNEIIAALKEYGIEVTRQTLYEDINILVRYGYDIVCVKGRNNKYFIGERAFERPEVEILMNIVGAAAEGEWLSRARCMRATRALHENYTAGQIGSLHGARR